MKPAHRYYYPTEFTNDTGFGQTLESAEELLDGRFAVVCERMFEVVSYIKCDDGNSYDVLLVKTCVGVYGPEDGADLNSGALVEAYVWINDASQSANAKMVELMQEQLGIYYPA